MKTKEMKNRRLITIGLLLSIGFFSAYAATETVDEGYLRYTVDTEAMTAEIYGPVSSSQEITDLVIPDYIDYKGGKVPVTSIRSNAFYENKNLSGSLTIGNSVQTIGNYAFEYCSGFTGSLIIPNSVQTIGNYAFAYCKGFNGSLTIGESVKTIGNWAFSSCRGFDGSLTIPNSVNTIGDYAFSECIGFDDLLTIGESVQTIGERAFNGCYGFNCSLTIPKSAVSIGANAFYQCYGFNGSLTIPNSVQTIGRGAFESCIGFTGSLIIGESVQTIEGWAFHGCRGFTGELVIPNSVQTIGNNAFSACSGFTSLLIKPQEVNIYYQAFSSCDNLQSVTCLATTPPPCIYQNSENFVFATSNYSKPLYVPAQSVEAYKTATEWEKFTYINPIVIEPTSLTLNKTQLELQVGETETLIATILPEGVTETELTWTSSNPQFADVSNDGTVTALAVGKTTITVTTENDLTATCDVTVVPVPASKVTLNVENVTLAVGQEYTLKAEVSPDNVTDKTIVWSTTGDEVVRVDDGKLTALSKGKATVSAACGTAFAECEVTVIGEGDWSIGDSGNSGDGDDKTPAEKTEGRAFFDGENLWLRVGQTGTISLTPSSPLTETPEFEWSVDDPQIAQMGTSGTESSISFTGVSIGTTGWSVKIKGSETVLTNGTIVVIAEKPITSIALDVEDITLALYAPPVNVKATLAPQDATEPTLKWEVTTGSEFISLEPADLTLSAMVSPQQEGTATVTVSAQDGSLTSTEFNVRVKALTADDVTVEPSDDTTGTDWNDDPVGDTEKGAVFEDYNLIMRVGQTAKLKLSAAGLDYLPEMEWSVENTTVATVSETGNSIEAVFRANAIGETSWEVKIKDTATVLATGKITVIAENPITQIILNPTEVTVAKNGDPITITATLTPVDSSDQELEWTLSTPGIVELLESVDNPLSVNIQPQSEGEVKLTATAKDGSGITASTMIRVTEPILDNFEFDFDGSMPGDNSGITLYIGDSYQLRIKTLEGYSMPDEITWESLNPGVASVSKDGTVIGVSAGITSVTASAMVNSRTVSATCVVTVVPVPASKVTLNVEDMTVLVGQSDQLKAEVEPSDVTDPTVIWKSENPDIAEVGDDGTVTGVSVGVTTITATCGDVSATCKVTVIEEEKEDQGDESGNTPEDDPDDGQGGNPGDDSGEGSGGNTGNEPGDEEGEEEEPAPEIPDTTVEKASTPLQLLRKGDGSSCTLVVMMELSDTQLSAQGYRFVFGYTPGGSTEPSVLDNTTHRYVHVDAETYNNQLNDFWVFAYYTDADGTLHVSYRCHLDGSFDDDFNASVLMGLASATPSSEIVGIYSLSGQYVGKETERLKEGIYVVKTLNGSYKLRK